MQIGQPEQQQEPTDQGNEAQDGPGPNGSLEGSLEIQGPDDRFPDVPNPDVTSQEIPNGGSQEVPGQDVRSEQIPDSERVRNSGPDIRPDESPELNVTSEAIPEEPDVIPQEIIVTEEPAIWNQEVTEAELCEFAIDVRPQWHERLTLMLGMDDGMVDILRDKYRQDVQAVSLEILLEWLKRNPGHGHRMVSIYIKLIS